MRHTSRKSDYKTKKSKSQRKKDKHSRSRSRSVSRSSSRSASRSSSRSLSRSHKRKTQTKGDKSRVNKHKNRLSSRSRSSPRSNSRSSHKKRVKTRHAKSKVHKHKRQSLSCSESQSRFRSRSRSQRTKTRSKTTKRRSHCHSPHADSDTDTPRHGNPRKHPKALRFDGKTNWLSFKKKFDSYRKVMRWSEEESKDYLMWSLEGKALDFLTITKIDLEKYSFRKIMKKLETRFGVQSPSEARVEQLIRSALRDFAAKLQKSSTSLSSSSETEEKLKRRKVLVSVSFVRNLDILRKIAESIKHGLAKSKRVSQKTQRAILAKNSKED